MWTEFTLELFYLKRNTVSFFSIVSCVLGAVICPESPRWLISVGRDDQALAIMRYAAATNGLNPDVVFKANGKLKDEHVETSKFRDLLRLVELT